MSKTKENIQEEIEEQLTWRDLEPDYGDYDDYYDVHDYENISEIYKAKKHLILKESAHDQLKNLTLILEENIRNYKKYPSLYIAGYVIDFLPANDSLPLNKRLEDNTNISFDLKFDKDYNSYKPKLIDNYYDKLLPVDCLSEEAFKGYSWSSKIEFSQFLDLTYAEFFEVINLLFSLENIKNFQ